MKRPPKNLLEGVFEELRLQHASRDKLRFYRYLDTISAFLSLGLPDGSSVLDLGCGQGHLCLTIKRLGHAPIGIDVNAKDALQLQHHGIPFHTCDLEKDPIPFDEDRFDCVLFTETIEHLDPRRVKYILGEIYRIVKPAGVLLLTTPNQASIQNGIRLLLGTKIILSPDHVREYTLRELTELLQASGFSEIFHEYLLAFDRFSGNGMRDSFESCLIRTKSRRDQMVMNAGKAVLYPIKAIVPRYRSLILIAARKMAGQ